MNYIGELLFHKSDVKEKDFALYMQGAMDFMDFLCDTCGGKSVDRDIMLNVIKDFWCLFGKPVEYDADSELLSGWGEDVYESLGTTENKDSL